MYKDQCQNISDVDRTKIIEKSDQTIASIEKLQQQL